MNFSDKTKKIVAIIPARGGSKRVPRKNVRDFCGLPIISYTIQAAINCGLFSRIIVSTEDLEIAEISKKNGAEIPFIRDSCIADDYTPISIVTLDVLNRIEPESKKIDFVAQLMPNCPLRTSADIIASYHQFIKDKSISQISIAKYGWQNPWWAIKKDESGYLTPLFPEQLKNRSQDLPEIFCPTGAIWWIQADVLRQYKTFHCDNKTGWEISWDHGIDVDTEDDWLLAELLMKKRLGQFK